MAYLAGAEMRVETSMGTRRPAWGRVPGEEHLSCYWRIPAHSVWTIPRDKNFRRPASWSCRQPFCEIYCQEHTQVSTIYIGEKSPRASGRGRRAISVLNKARPQEKLVNQTLAWWGITRAYLTLEKKIPTLAHSSHPLP